jgi:hypothetical protein
VVTMTMPARMPPGSGQNPPAAIAKAGTNT